MKKKVGLVHIQGGLGHSQGGLKHSQGGIEHSQGLYHCCYFLLLSPFYLLTKLSTKHGESV